MYSASKQRYLTKNGRKGECPKYIVQLTTPGMTVLYQRVDIINDERLYILSLNTWNLIFVLSVFKLVQL